MKETATVPFMVRKSTIKFDSLNTGGWVTLKSGRHRITSIQSVKINGNMIEVIGRCK